MNQYKNKCGYCGKVFMDSHPPRELTRDNECPGCEEKHYQWSQNERSTKHEKMQIESG